MVMEPVFALKPCMASGHCLEGSVNVMKAGNHPLVNWVGTRVLKCL